MRSPGTSFPDPENAYIHAGRLARQGVLMIRLRPILVGTRRIRKLLRARARFWDKMGNVGHSVLYH
jgi:hypothetical protein